MKFDLLIDFCKQKYPEKTIEICEAIDLLVDGLNSLKSEVGNSVPVLFDNNEYDLVDEYKNHAKMIAGIIQNLNNVSNSMTVDETKENEQESDSILSDILAINYNDKSFNVDTNIPHTLYEDFTYTRPAGIKIEDTYLEANEWRDIFNKCCQYLLKKDKKIFHSFLDDISMQGRSRKYFSKAPEQLRDPELIKGSDIYLECNVNAIFVRNIIIKMLEKYEIPKRKCHIFIRRDLTSLHDNSYILQVKETTKKIEESSDEVKIGQFAKEFFAKYFKSDFPIEQLSYFTNKKWCHDTFGICYPILKQVDINLPINEQVNYNNEYRRYYVKPVLEIGTSHYIICQEWYAEFKPKLIDWINNNTVNTIEATINSPLMEKDDKIKFSKDYNSITIPKSLFIHILSTIYKYDKQPFETGNLSMLFSSLIIKSSKYEKPHHVINNIRKYLEHEKIISLYGESKKGKYIITNPNKLEELIKKYNSPIKNSNNNTSIQHREVVVYSYADEKQIVVDVGNPHDKYVLLHKYCVDKQPGYKFTAQSKEYVIVNFKGKKSSPN